MQQRAEAVEYGPMDRLSDYNYDLPKELIAQHPTERREHSRLMVLTRATGELVHSRFDRLGERLRPGDLLVLNDTKVLRARLWGARATGGRIEALIVAALDGGRREVLLKPGSRLKVGERLSFEGGALSAVLCSKTKEGSWVVEFEQEDRLDALLEEVGRMPLPPYIKRDYPKDIYAEEDAQRYQTVYASSPGAIAAPTAGLHFTPELLAGLESRGVLVRRITLHVGRGTFRPVQSEDIRGHAMDAEHFRISEDTAEEIRRAAKEGRRVVAVGTTTCRALETAGESGEAQAQAGWTRKFIYPPYRFRVVDALVTNFHLPKSTLLLLVSAFAGRDAILNAYREAVEKRYRFYSYGDAMLIV